MNNKYQPYYTTSRTHEDDVATAIATFLFSKDLNARDDAQYFIVDHAVLTDEDYQRLMIELIEQIETDNLHRGTDKTIVLEKLLYTRNGLPEVSKEVFALVVNRLRESSHHTCQKIYEENLKR